MKKTTLLIAFINLALHSFSQNVGIGLTTPVAKLQINSTSTASRPLLMLSDSIGGVSNTIEFATQGISNKWSLSSSSQSNANTSFLRFGFSGGLTPFTILGDGRATINSSNIINALDVNSTSSQTAIFNGGSQMFISLAEQGNMRGYIGSYSGNTEDVDFGAHGSNPTGKVHLVTTGNPRLTVTPNGNIGIGTQTPADKLDVNGNLNVAQTIKANGVAGQPGQVLSLNSNGNIAWADFNEFKNHRTFFWSPDAITWTVPAGVTRVMVEGWGGGGGGSFIGSGGGGGYVCGWYTVVPGNSVQFVIGKGGYGGTGVSEALDGETTTIYIVSSSSYETIYAFGGRSCKIGGNGIAYIGKGGRYGPGSKAIGKNGEDGQTNRIEYIQTNATTFLEATIGGKGGDAGNTLHTGSAGGYRLYNPSTSTQIKEVIPDQAGDNGGGGAGHYTGYEVSCIGGFGIVIIHY